MNTFENRKNVMTNEERIIEPSTRERVNFFVDSGLMAKLREKSIRDNIPMSRVIDAALKSYLNLNEKKEILATTDIDLYHQLEIIVPDSTASPVSKSLFAKMENLLISYTYTSCWMGSGSKNPNRIGTKVFAYINDEQSKQFSELYNWIVVEAKEEKISIALDQKAI